MLAYYKDRVAGVIITEKKKSHYLDPKQDIKLIWINGQIDKNDRGQMGRDTVFECYRVMADREGTGGDHSHATWGPRCCEISSSSLGGRVEMIIGEIVQQPFAGATSAEPGRLLAKFWLQYFIILVILFELFISL